jgi:hypothetical protein
MIPQRLVTSVAWGGGNRGEHRLGGGEAPSASKTTRGQKVHIWH